VDINNKRALAYSFRFNVCQRVPVNAAIDVSIETYNLAKLSNIFFSQSRKICE
jgi:hypothetical protein